MVFFVSIQKQFGIPRIGMHIKLPFLTKKLLFATFRTRTFAFHAVQTIPTRNHRTTTARYPCYHDMLVFDIRNVRFVTVEFLELKRVSFILFVYS